MATGKRKGELRDKMRQACAIAGHKVIGMSLNQMVELVLEHGLPSRKEREATLAASLEEPNAG